MKKVLAFLLTAAMLLSCMSFATAEAGDVVILFTNDVHCAIDDNLGYAKLAGVRDSEIAAGNEVILVDAGDAIQGGPVGAMSKGGYIIDIMNNVGYDIAIPGNHEFDYGMDRFFEITGLANASYISANFVDLRTGAPALDAYKIIEKGGVKIGFVGVCTPKTLTSSTPVYFQDAEGNWIYGFCQDETGEAIWAAVQTAVDAVRAEGVDLVIAVAHLGIEAECAPYLSTDLILNTTGIDAVIDGHSHSVIDGAEVLNKNGEKVLLMQTGTKIENIGKLTISGGKLSFTMITEAEPSDNATAFIDSVKAEYEAVLNQVVAHTDVDLVIKDPVTGERIVRSAETNLGDLCADAYRILSGADIAVVNGGGVRDVLPTGDITYAQILAVHPFSNAMCVIEITGDKILDMLEWGVHSLPGEFGGFLQVSGMTYEINMNVDSTCVTNVDGMFDHVEGARRVQNVTIGGEPLDPEKTYTLASHNYKLKNKGDGYTMFEGCKLLQDEVMLDNQVLMTYIIENLGGSVGEEYANPYGEGRIVAIQKD